MSKNTMKSAISALKNLTDDELSVISFAMPWQQGAEDSTTDSGTKDPDGFNVVSQLGDLGDRETLQQTCWNKFNTNPHVGTAVRGQVGRLTGLGFEITSEIQEIQEAIEETEFDPRNRLYSFWSKYVGRAIIEGELFLCLTVHQDGFVEVDFLDPSNISGGSDDGIIYHPNKATLPLFYYVTPPDSRNNANQRGAMLVPSIYIAYYPELIKVAESVSGFNRTLLKDSEGGAKYAKLGKFKRFIVAWDRSFVTRRNISYLRTILEWLNQYETLKKYEIDHKKSAGAYLWVVTMEDPKAFRTWLSLTDDERRKTGLMAKKTPGSTLILPPGMTMVAQNPKLPTISEGDTDILHMVTSGLNEPEDVSTGQSKGTFASVKASRGPMSDRTSDEIAYFERFLRYDFYRAVFFLKTKMGKFPEDFSIKEAIDYNDNQEPIFKKLKKKPEKLIDISFPVSEVIDAEARAKAYLGVKHGSLYDTLGIPNNEIAKKLGFGNYRRLRLSRETEVKRYPELAPPVDSGGEQLEPGNKKIIKKANPKKETPSNPAKPIVKKPIVKK
jgi:hypothetical protein